MQLKSFNKVDEFLHDFILKGKFTSPFKEYGQKC